MAAELHATSSQVEGEGSEGLDQDFVWPADETSFSTVDLQVSAQTLSRHTSPTFSRHPLRSGDAGQIVCAMAKLRHM